MSLPEALVLVGLILMALGAVLGLLAFLKMASRPGPRAAGFLLIGPIPIVFYARGGKLVWAILVLMAIALLAPLLAMALGVLSS